ncbi:Late embryogenesis abundant protein 32 [Bienertia sinuspersici]
MAQQQPKKESDGPEQQNAIKYGDVFHVSGQTSEKPILPEDAASMESAEKIVMGQSPIGGPASVMRSAADVNVDLGLVDPNSRRTTEGIRVTKSNVEGTPIVTESINNERLVTIGETLEAVAHCAGNQAIDKADAAAIAAAEKRAVGANAPPGWGLGAQARNAADWNAKAPRDELVTTIDDVLKDASLKLPHDKAVTREDANVIMEAEVKNDPEMTTTIGGVETQISQEALGQENGPIKYGDVFLVSGQVANEPILPEDAAAMEAGERNVMGQSPLFGPASVMESAAHINVESGSVDPSPTPNDKGINVSETEKDGIRIVTESVNDEVVGQYVDPNFTGKSEPPPPPTPEVESVSIGEALEAVALCAGDHAVDNADAAAIEIAEKRALGTDTSPHGGLGEEARHAATWNSQTLRCEIRTTMDDILRDASDKLPLDRPVTHEDAKAILEAEAHHDPANAITAGGVGEMMSAAASLNIPKS